MRDEFIKIRRIKDPNAWVWKMKTSILGPRHKAPELTCIRHPDSGELVATPEGIKKVTLNHNMKILTKNTVRPEDKTGAT